MNGFSIERIGKKNPDQPPRFVGTALAMAVKIRWKNEISIRIVCQFRYLKCDRMGVDCTNQPEIVAPFKSSWVVAREIGKWNLRRPLKLGRQGRKILRSVWQFLASKVRGYGTGNIVGVEQ